MRAKSLNHPNAGLVTIGVQRFITATHAAEPGRILIHATQRKPADGHVVGDWLVRRQGQGDIDYPHSDNYMRRVDQSARRYGTDDHLGDAIPLPLGVIVGSATIEACYPILSGEPGTPDANPPCIIPDPTTLMLWHGQPACDRFNPWADQGTDISEQMPYGDWTPGRYAWLLTDAASTNERCPWCWGSGGNPGSLGDECPCCHWAGRCDPIPAKGAQRIWNWAVA